MAQCLFWLGSDSVVVSVTRDRWVAGSSLSFMSFKSKILYRLHCTGSTKGNVVKSINWDLEKLSGSRLSDHLRIRSNTVFIYSNVRWIFSHFLDKIREIKMFEISIDPLS